MASVRPVRRADAVLAWWLAATAPTADALGVDVAVVDLREVDLPLGEEPEEPHTGRYAHERTRRWSALVADADAFVVLTSEHNHSLPASLKNAFDHLGPEWAGKPVAWVGYGNTSAGTRAVHAGKQVATTLGLVSVAPDVTLRLGDPMDATRDRPATRDRVATRALTRLVAHARALRGLRAPTLTVAGLAPGLASSRAVASDAAELLVLQRCCWVDEALANETLDVPAWRDDVAAVREAIGARWVLVVREGARIVASVQAWREGDRWYIGRLMVAPDQRRRGVARALLRQAEAARPEGVAEVALMTGARSASNIALYESEGYRLVGPLGGQDAVTLVKRPAR